MKRRTARNRIALLMTTLGLVAMVLALFGPQLRSAVAIIWDLGDLFAGVSGGSYKVYSNAGSSKQTISNGTGGYTTGCAFNSSTTQLYTTDFSGGRVVKYADADPHGSSSFTTTGQSEPESFAFKKNGGYFVGGPGAAVILEYDATDTLIASYPVAATDRTGGTDWVDLAVNQTTIFYTGEGRLIKRYDTVIGQLADFATLPGAGNAYAFRLLPPFDGSGGLIVADAVNVKRLDSSGTVIQTYSVSGVSDFFALNLDPDGQTFWTGSISNGNLYRFNIATGGADNQIQTISTGSNGYLFGVCLKGEITGGIGACIDPPANMVAWFPGDGNAADIVGANHGTLRGGTTFAAGMVDQAFNLDGINGFINVPDSPSLNFGTSDFTVDVWVNFRDLSGEQVLVEKYIETFSSAATGWSLTKLSDNRIRFGTSGDEQITSGSPLPIVTDSWNHFAARRSAGTVSIFLNGNIVATGTSTVNVNSSSSVKFGHRGDPNDTSGSTDTRGFYLSGYIDEVEIFNRALADEEILRISNAGSFGKCKPVCVAPPDNLVAWFTGDHTTVDIAGGSFGTLQNGATYGPGMVGEAFSFSPDNSAFVQVPDSDQWALGNADFTIDLWINLNSGVDCDGDFCLSSFIANNEGGGPQNKWVFECKNGELNFHINSPDIGDPGIDVTGEVVVPRNPGWHHVAVTRAGSTYTFYLDGQSGGSVQNAATIPNPNAPLVIGQNGEGSGYVDGSIDEVEIFHSALTAAQIKSIFDAHTEGKCRPQQSDVNGAFVDKHETFVQTSTADPAPEGAAPFQLVVGVDATGPNNITSANFTPPSGSATALISTDGVEFNFFSANFGDLNSFNAAFPNGDYMLDIHTAHAPFLLTPIITLPGNAYPDLPKILNTNWSGNALQIQHPDQSFTFDWSNFCASCVARPTGAPGLNWSGPVTDTSYITLRIADGSDSVVLEQSFSSLITSFPMPANTLQPGMLYHAQLQFANLEDRSENGVQLGSQYATVTKFDIVSGTLVPPPVCFNGHTYMLTTAAESWTQAEAEAISNGGHLVAINNVTEQTFLANYFLTEQFLLQPLWIGLTDRAKEGKFVWTTIVSIGKKTTNAPLTYSNWNPSTHEPNDCCNTKIKHEEDYVAMNWHYARNLTDPIGSWNDLPNTGTLLDGNAHGPYFGIIEIPNCAQ